MGCVLPAGVGPGARAPGVAFRRTAGQRAVHDHQQGLRLRHEGCDDRRRSACGGPRRHCRRGRHGDDDERALSASQGARRLSPGPRRDQGSHVPRRARGRLRASPHGHLCGGLPPGIISSRAPLRTLSRRNRCMRAKRAQIRRLIRGRNRRRENLRQGRRKRSRSRTSSRAEPIRQKSPRSSPPSRKTAR